MATNTWIESVRRRRQLLVYKHESMDSSGWQGIFEQGLEEFNRLAHANHLGVTAAASNEPPSAHGEAGADIMASLAGSQIIVPHDLVPNPIAFNNSLPHGRTIKIPSQNRRILKAFVYVPRELPVQVPRGYRPSGPGIRLVLFVHELVHCCGLSDAEHSRDPGIFFFPLNLLVGATPEEDRIDSGRFGSDNLPIGMPPCVLDEATASLIQPLWRPTAEWEPESSRGPLGANRRGDAMAAREVQHLRDRGPAGRDAQC